MRSPGRVSERAVCQRCLALPLRYVSCGREAEDLDSALIGAVDGSKRTLRRRCGDGSEHSCTLRSVRRASGSGTYHLSIPHLTRLSSASRRNARYSLYTSVRGNAGRAVVAPGPITYTGLISGQTRNRRPRTRGVRRDAARRSPVSRALTVARAQGLSGMGRGVKLKIRVSGISGCTEGGGSSRTVYREAG